MVSLPLAFALPSLDRFASKSVNCEEKTEDFAPLIPGDKSTYIYKTEDAYHEQYTRSLYAITKKKGGWDCFRHYEILASGAVPYFLGIDGLIKRPAVMHSFPKDLVKQAMELPGVPSQAEVRTGARRTLDRTAFDMKEYCRIHGELMQWTREKLTTQATADYVLEMLRQYTGISEPRVLFLSSSGSDYSSGFLFSSLFQKLQLNISSLRPRKKGYFDDFSGSTAKLYGKGFGYSRTLRAPELHRQCGSQRGDELLEELVTKRLVLGYFNTLIITNAGNRRCDIRKGYGKATLKTVRAYLHRFPRTAVLTVDGSDIKGCHTDFRGQLPHVDLFFMREADHLDRHTKDLAKAVVRRYV